MKLSKKGAITFLEKFNSLTKSHVGIFQDAPSLKKAYLTDIFQELIDTRIDVVPIIIQGKWCEIDTPQDLKRAKLQFH